MKFFRSADTGEIYSLTLEARDTLEEMAAQAPMTMNELAGRIEDIITQMGDYKDSGAVEEYKRSLVMQLNAWALEYNNEEPVGLKPRPLLQEVARKIEEGEL